MDNKILLLVEDNKTLIKSKGRRDGLIQTVVTYVRNGKTVTRKQWVRSEFADHAKKNEEQKAETILRQSEKEEQKRKRKLEEEEDKHDMQDFKERKKLERRQLEVATGGSKDESLDKYHKQIKKRRMKEESESREKAEEQKKEDRKKRKEEDKEKRSAFGQKDNTMAENRSKLNIM